ncbi:MAG: flagellar filament capping protein FliD, partial [Verrucomicrobiae bacterium]|nr:flagellar filament capping protein FliD [Verrucomicrobiae bacterium]
ASYNPATDRIELSSSAPIQLGSAADTSNFLQVARLTQNGTGSVVSALPLGVIKVSAPLQNANFATAISDGGSGAGEFTINGVSISFNASTDTLTDVLARINNSTAGVLAQYDPVQDRVVLINKTTGNVAIHLADVTGNFLAATGLTASAGGTFVAGQDLVYTLNGSAPITSRSNTAAADSHGISGLTITALTTGTTTVTVTADPSPARTAIEEFVAQYNKVQALIASATAVASSATGTTTNGVLAGDRDVAALASELRRLVFGEVTGLSGRITRLDQLGYSTNGNDDTLTLADAAKLTEQLSSRLADVAEFFGHATNGLAQRLDSLLQRQAGDDGYLVSRQNTFTTQRNRIEEQIAAMERAVQANRERLIQSFIAMERAQAQIQRQLQFLQQRFGADRT